MVLNKRERLFVWCQFFYPELISTGQVITELFVRLSDKFDIEIHCAQPTIIKSDKVPTVLHYKGIRIVRVWSSTFSKILMTGKIINQLTFAISIFIKALFLPQGSRLNVFTDPFFLPLLLYILYPIKRFKYTITLFDLYPETLAENKVLSMDGFFYRLIDNLTNKVYANASNVITIGRCMQKIVSSRPINWVKKPTFIPIWCDADNVRKKTLHKNYFRDFWNLTKNTFVVGYSGNLAKFHPIETFLETANLLNKRKDIKFVFVGEGAKKDLAEEFCQKKELTNCFFQTYVKREELGSLLASFDCGLVGLNREQSGLSVPSKAIGLVTAGIPVIACVDESSETALMLKEIKCGCICDPESPSELAKKIIDLKNDRDKYNIWQENGRKAVNQKFNINSVVEQYTNILFM